ncbi:hypothetical protein HII31_12201 [Pseudocercospora fuligena]|uniref:Uncharacterized protein n=1 Tax=Pseudocercospora fuligena TaxID=685502 RepID=A0A8H6R8S8_9PEZI|nr:hypothetical protein HII31_12201 [Pseudocercospora fuligena]
MSAGAQKASRPTKQSRSRSSTSSSSDDSNDSHVSAIQRFRSRLDDSFGRNQYHESRILQCLASSSYPSSDSASTSSPSINSEAFAARLGLFTISHPGAASPRDLVVRVMDWAEDVEQYAPELGRVMEKTPLLPQVLRDHGARYGTLEKERVRRYRASENVASYWDAIGSRKINLYVQENEVLDQDIRSRRGNTAPTWWQCSLVAVLVLFSLAVASWLLLMEHSDVEG